MKSIFQLLSFSPEKAAAVVAFGLLGLTAVAAPQPGAEAAVSPPPTAAQSALVAPEEDILDIRGPIHIPAAFRWLPWSGGALAASASVSVPGPSFADRDASCRMKSRWKNLPPRAR